MIRKWIRTAVAATAMLGSVALHAAPAIQPFEPDSMERIVAARKGTPFVLMVWSLDCTYCQASMKALAEERRKRKDLHVVTLSTDSADDPQAVAMMRKKLHAAGLMRDAWAFGSAPAEQLRYAIDPKWHGEKPRSYWFNARGESIPYSGVLTAGTIDRLTGR